MLTPARARKGRSPRRCRSRCGSASWTSCRPRRTPARRLPATRRLRGSTCASRAVTAAAGHARIKVEAIGNVFFDVNNSDITIVQDTTPPVTTATLSPPIQNGWYASPTLTLTADDGAGSGVNHIDYSIDGGPSQVYSGPISGFSTGNHFVQYHATDNAGNVEATKLIAFKADSDKPTVTITRPKAGKEVKRA